MISVVFKAGNRLLSFEFVKFDILFSAQGQFDFFYEVGDPHQHEYIQASALQKLCGRKTSTVSMWCNRRIGKEEGILKSTRQETKMAPKKNQGMMRLISSMTSIS